MALQLSLLTEPDIPAYTHLECVAFQSGIAHVLTGPPTAANESKVAAGHLHAMRNDRSARFLQVVDPATGEMIAGAKWNLYPRGSTAEELDRMFDRTGAEPVHRMILGELDRNRREIMGGKPHFVLQLLFTHPRHYRRGAASLAVRWGTERADELGLECYLEASIEGRPLYERVGFVAVKELRFDMKEYGREDLGVDRVAIMIRQPRPQENLPGDSQKHEAVDIDSGNPEPA